MYATPDLPEHIKSLLVEIKDTIDEAFLTVSQKLDTDDVVVILYDEQGPLGDVEPHWQKGEYRLVAEERSRLLMPRRIASTVDKTPPTHFALVIFSEQITVIHRRKPDSDQFGGDFE